MTDTTGTATKAPDTTPADAPGNARTKIFIYDIVVVLVLLAIGALYFKHKDWFDIGGSDSVNLSIHCIWFGALGGIIISLKGVYDHAVGGAPWNDSFNLWHIGRPVSGGIAGLMTFLLLQLASSSIPSEAVAYAAAFIFGTQERRFFDLLSEVARLIVQVPSEKTPTPLTVASITPAQGAANTSVTIAGTGFDLKATAALGGTSIGNLAVKNATTITGVVPARPAGAELVDVVVTNPDGTSATLPKAFRFTA